MKYSDCELLIIFIVIFNQDKYFASEKNINATKNVLENSEKWNLLSLGNLRSNVRSIVKGGWILKTEQEKKILNVVTDTAYWMYFITSILIYLFFFNGNSNINVGLLFWNTEQEALVWLRIFLKCGRLCKQAGFEMKREKSKDVRPVW